jgi:hypothetical protein
LAFILIPAAVWAIQSPEPPKHQLNLTQIAVVRERFERRTDKDFKYSANDNRGDLFSRYRFGFGYSYGSDLSGEVVYQYSEDLFWTPTQNASNDDSDLLLADLKIATTDGTAVLGRQRISKGNERILGESNWNNISNAWDAIRFETQPVDVFAGKIGVSGRMTDNGRLVGASTDTRLGETMVTFIHDGEPGQVTDQYTFDQLYKSKFGSSKIDAELDGQVGSEGSKELKAWAGYTRLTTQIRPRLSGYLEADIASGGQSANVASNFTNPAGTKHLSNGIEDVQGWSNMEELAAQVGYQIPRGSLIELSYHRFWLYSAEDAWYNKNDLVNSSGATKFYDPSGKYGRDVGQEVDLDSSWSVEKSTVFSIGAAAFVPGSFVKSFLPAGQVRNQYWFYSQLNIRFAG